MLKIRIQGTKKDIKWFKKIVERDKRIKLLQVSLPLSNKGTNRFYRLYLDIDREK